MLARGAVLLGKAARTPGEAAEARAYERKELTNLIRVGGKLAVLGVDERHAMGAWHVLRPGSFDIPQGDPGGSDQEGRNLTHGRALCGRIVVSNGYAADWRPPRGELCAACAERI